MGVVFAPALLAQPATVRVLSTRPDGLRLEVTAAYPAPLATTLEAARVRRLDAAAVRVAVGDELTVTYPVALPALAAPRVSIVSAEGDDATLAPGTAAAWLTGALVQAGPPGLARQAPLSTVSVRLLAYDAAAQRLTRFHRLVVDVQFGTPSIGAVAGAVSGAEGARRVAHVPNPHLSVARSALADGTWFRLAIPSEGVIRLDAAVVTAMGLSAASTDPARLRIFGGSGAPLPAQTDAPRVADLVEYPSVAVGGGDGRFDATDGVVFYARGPVTWALSASGEWEHTTHPYSTTTYVFVKVDDAPATRRAPETVAFPGNGAADRTEVEGRFVADFDQYMWSKENRGSGLTYVTPTFALGTTRTLVQSSDLVGLAPGAIQYVVQCGGALGGRVGGGDAVHGGRADAGGVELRQRRERPGEPAGLRAAHLVCADLCRRQLHARRAPRGRGQHPAGRRCGLRAGLLPADPLGHKRPAALCHPARRWPGRTALRSPVSRARPRCGT